jgi:hypothetical protein
MFIVLLYLVSALLAPAPLVSMVVDVQPHTDRLDVVVRLLSSDARYQDFAITVEDVTTPVHAPLSALQTITTTIPLDLPAVCGARVVTDLVITARVLTDTVAFARMGVGSVVTRDCPLRLYIP